MPLRSNETSPGVTFRWPLVLQSNGCTTICRYNRNRQTLCKSAAPHTSQGHYGFYGFPVVDWFCLFVYLWVLNFPLLDCSEFGNFVITLILRERNGSGRVVTSTNDFVTIIYRYQFACTERTFASLRCKTTNSFIWLLLYMFETLISEFVVWHLAEIQYAEIHIGIE